ncbi:MAG: PhzF family phenazine biosynthesis protein [Micrococcaceae bacterium]
MKQYIVDAFTDKVFSGNPAAICLLDEFFEEDILQSISCENNLSETAFLVPDGGKYQLRWFTPAGEIDLCGHATLASAYVLSRCVDPTAESFSFKTKSGILEVEKHGNLFEMNFPAFDLQKIAVTNEISVALGTKPREVYLGRDLVCVFEDEADVRQLNPDIEKVKKLEGLLLHVTAKGNNYDCVSRTFAPKHNIDEDPVNGTGHCHLFPYWSKKLEKTKLVGYQASARGGVLYGEVQGDRVLLGGEAVLYSSAEIFVH